MNLLDANDQRGEYPASWYAHSARAPDPLDPLDGDTQCQVCVVGAGYTGLSCALHLAEQGVNVVLVDAHRVGWGASGRNGGQLGTGLRLEQQALESMLGHEHAHALWQLSERGKTIIKERCDEYDIDCDYRSGILYADHRRRFTRHSRAHVEHLRDNYNYSSISFVDQAQINAMLGTTHYYSGTLDTGAGHIHPLKLAFGLARACVARGVRVFEQTRVTSIESQSAQQVVTESGTIRAERVVLACNGYLGSLNQQVAARVMPINNFIIATEPLDDDLARQLIRDNVAVADSRFVVNYFRLSTDKRLLFGGRETYGYSFPQDIKSFVRKAMLKVYPQLKHTRIDFGWGGTLAVTRNRMPHFYRDNDSILSVSGYSGHGVSMANLAGVLAAKATMGDTKDFDQLAQVPSPGFPGGRWLRSPLLMLGMFYYSARDQL